MKRMKWMLVVFLAVCVTAPAFAQSNERLNKLDTKTLDSIRADWRTTRKIKNSKIMNEQMTSNAFAAPVKALQKELEKASLNYKKAQLDKASSESIRHNCERILKSIEQSGKFDAQMIKDLKTLAENEQDPEKTQRVLLMLVARYNIELNIEPETEVVSCVSCGKKITEEGQHCAATG